MAASICCVPSPVLCFDGSIASFIDVSDLHANLLFPPSFLLAAASLFMQPTSLIMPILLFVSADKVFTDESATTVSDSHASNLRTKLSPPFLSPPITAATSKLSLFVQFPELLFVESFFFFFFCCPLLPSAADENLNEYRLLFFLDALLLTVVSDDDDDFMPDGFDEDKLSTFGVDSSSFSVVVVSW